METATMGKVLVSARIENISDSLAARAGRIRPDEVRAVDVHEALVDTGAKLLGLPRRMIEQLGLDLFETREAQTSVGRAPCAIYRAVWLTVEGRQCSVDVSQVSDDCPVLIGYVPLELLDFVVDPIQQRLIPNPKDSGGRILDLL
jgi:predicted aspartyl protease